MTDLFGREINVGDYVARHSGTRSYEMDFMYRIFGIDEEKDLVYLVSWPKPGDTRGWIRYEQVLNIFSKMTENPEEWYKKLGGNYQPAKRVWSWAVIKTYPPVWQEYDKQKKK